MVVVYEIRLASVLIEKIVGVFVTCAYDKRTIYEKNVAKLGHGVHVMVKTSNWPLLNLYVFGKLCLDMIQTIWIQEPSSVYKDISVCRLWG